MSIMYELHILPIVPNSPKVEFYQTINKNLICIAPVIRTYIEKMEFKVRQNRLMRRKLDRKINKNADNEIL